MSELFGSTVRVKTGMASPETPKRPVMPGVLILEALAQATGILAFKTVGRVPDETS